MPPALVGTKPGRQANSAEAQGNLPGRVKRSIRRKLESFENDLEEPLPLWLLWLLQGNCQTRKFLKLSP
jgi:hypothetical protein